MLSYASKLSPLEGAELKFKLASKYFNFLCWFKTFYLILLSIKPRRRSDVYVRFLQGEPSLCRSTRLVMGFQNPQKVMSSKNSRPTHLPRCGPPHLYLALKFPSGILCLDELLVLENWHFDSNG